MERTKPMKLYTQDASDVSVAITAKMAKMKKNIKKTSNKITNYKLKRQNRTNCNIKFEIVFIDIYFLY